MEMTKRYTEKEFTTYKITNNPGPKKSTDKHYNDQNGEGKKQKNRDK